MKLIDRIKNFWKNLGNPDIEDDEVLTYDEKKQLEEVIKATKSNKKFVPKAEINEKKAEKNMKSKKEEIERNEK